MKKIFKTFAAAAMAALMAASVVCTGAVSASALEKDSKTVLLSLAAKQSIGDVTSGRSEVHIASAEDSESYYEYYIKSDATIDIISFVGEDTIVYVPDELDGYAVTGINGGAFYGHSNLMEVYLPDSVVSIGDYAFANCPELYKVEIHNPAVKSIGHFVFADSNVGDVSKLCKNVESVGEGACDDTLWFSEQDPGMVYLGKVAYAYKGDMPENTKIEIKDGTKGIAAAAFFNCANLKSVTIPDGVKNIGEAAFYGCTSLSDISIPNSVERMGAVVLTNTEWYNNQPDGVIYIGDICYGYKGSMPANTEITVKNGTKLIAGAAFANQVNVEKNIQNLKSVKLPSSVKVIDELAFYGATGLSSINIPDGVTTIGKMAFCGCNSLKTVTVPMTVTSIGDLAFGFSIDTETGEPGRSDGFTLKGYANTESEYYSHLYTVNFTSLGTQTATDVKLSKTSMTMGVGEVYTISATVSPNYIHQAVSWSSGNTSVAEVSNSGRITAKATGTATITVKKHSKSASCKITVKKAPTSITLNATELTLDIGETFDLNSSLPSGEGSYAIYYLSDNPSVASVKKSGGLVTAVAPGTAKVTAVTYNGMVVTCNVTVKGTAETLILGDVNSDGNVNLRDAIEIQKCVLAIISFNDKQKRCGDVDKSGEVKLIDSIYVQKHCLGMPNSISGIGEKLSSPEPSEPSKPVDITAEYANEVVRLVNVVRNNAGLDTLANRKDVAKAAQVRAKELTQLFSHTRPDGSDCFSVIEEKNIRWDALGENIAAGQKSPDEVINAWMNSEGHRANILGMDYNGIGVGCYSKNGTLYWTQIFIGA